MLRNNDPEYTYIQKIENIKDTYYQKKQILESIEHKSGRIFLKLTSKTQKEILEISSKNEIYFLLKNMDPDEVTDVLQKIKNENKRKEILENLQEDVKNKVEFLLRFHPESAAGLMNLNYIIVSSNENISSITNIVIKHEKRTSKFPVILVEENGKLIGELSGHMLALKRANSLAKQSITKIHSVKYNESQQKIIQTFKETKHNKVIVLDDNNKILGIIFSDDILSLIQNESDKSLYDFAGLKKEETIKDTIREKVKHRYVWLIVSLCASFFVAMTIVPFEETIERLVILAIYLPIVAMIGGNAATQTLAIIVRGLTLNQINNKNARKIVGKEILASMINGIIIGTLLGTVTFIINKSIMFSIVISLAMFVNLCVAGLFGSVIPLIVKKFGKDPANSAIMFITTATDIFGFFVFLTLATILL